MLSHPHFERSISLNDLDTSVKVREHVQKDVVNPEDDSKHSFFKSMSQFTLVLRSFKDFPVDYKKFLYSYLVDLVVFRELEECKRLNWCEGLFPMVPVLTMGDGNCLMHAASIGMWAVSDRYHTLRKLVYNALLEDVDRFYHKRWQREMEVSNLSRHGYEMTEEQWTKEWQIVLELVSQGEYPLGNNGMQYSSLEEIHIFVLANVLRRTIIVISNDIQRGNYDEPLTPLNYPGIYLPLNWDPVDCVKTPLVIGYSQGHFTAVVSFEDGVFDRGEVIDDYGVKVHGVPLQQHNGKPLPIHFLLEDEEDIGDGLIRQYLDCTRVPHRDPQSNKDVITLAAKLQFMKPPGCIAGLVDSFFSSAQDTYTIMLHQKSENHSCQTPLLQLEPCKTENCQFFGTYETLYLCSKCLDEYLMNESSGAAGKVKEALVNKQMEGRHYESHQKQQQQPNELQLQQGFEKHQHQQQQQLLSEQQQNPQKLQQNMCAKGDCNHISYQGCGDLCLRCYDSDVLLRQQNATSSNNATPTTSCVNKVNGCEFFGIPQQEGFCSRCYERFCAEMQSLRIEDSRKPRGQTGQGLPQERRCQNQGCTRPACPELYDRCVECYGDCIKQFIHANERQSMEAFAAPSPEQPPQTPLLPKLCTMPACQNEGQEKYGGHCVHCFQIRPYEVPLDIERPSQTFKQNEQGFSSPFSHQPPSHNVHSLLYCETPACGQPLGETSGTLCTKCIMKKFQLKRKVSPQQQQPFFIEKTLPSNEEPQSSERKEEVLRARERLQPLFIPPPRDQLPFGNTAPRIPERKVLEVFKPGNGNAENQESGTRCLTPNCPFFANPETQFLCTSCHQKEKKEWEKINKMAQRQLPQLRNCAFTNCYNWESPGNGGLCDKCFQTGIRNEKVWDSQNRRQPPREPQRQQPVSPKKSSPRKTTNFISTGLPCNSPGCLRFGTEDKQGYCDRCFEKQQSRQAIKPSPLTELPSSANIRRERPEQIPNPNPIAHEPVLVSQPQSRVFGERSGRFSNICVQEGCKMTGSAHFGGYCSKCFEDYTKLHSYPESVADLVSCQEPPSPEQSVNTEPVSTGLTTLPPISPRTCAMPRCNNQVQPSTMSHCRDCLAKLYPQYARANNMT